MKGCRAFSFLHAGVVGVSVHSALWHLLSNACVGATCWGWWVPLQPGSFPVAPWCFGEWELSFKIRGLCTFMVSQWQGPCGALSDWRATRGYGPMLSVMCTCVSATTRVYACAGLSTLASMLSQKKTFVCILQIQWFAAESSCISTGMTILMTDVRRSSLICYLVHSSLPLAWLQETWGGFWIIHVLQTLYRRRYLWKAVHICTTKLLFLCAQTTGLHPAKSYAMITGGSPPIPVRV